MTDNLFRATVEGTEVFGFIEGLSFHYLKKSNHDGWIRYRDEVSDFTDLRPVKVVDMDSVVIDPQLEKWILAVCEYTANTLATANFKAAIDLRETAVRLRRAIKSDSQLSTPAEPATGGELRCEDEGCLHYDHGFKFPKIGIKSPTHETTEITTTSVGKFECVLEGHSKCEVNAPQSPKVTIELTEEEAKHPYTVLVGISPRGVANFIQDSVIDEIKVPLKDWDDWHSTKKNLLHNLGVLYLTPRMEEPKEFGAVVTACLGDEETQSAQRRFIRYSANYVENAWVSEHGTFHDWSDLINPTRVEGKR